MPSPEEERRLLGTVVEMYSAGVLPDALELVSHDMVRLSGWGLLGCGDYWAPVGAGTVGHARYGVPVAGVLAVGFAVPMGTRA